VAPTSRRKAQPCPKLEREATVGVHESWETELENDLAGIEENGFFILGAMADYENGV